MAIKYLTYAAVAVVGAVAVNHPGGEATVKYFPNGHVEIVSFYDVNLDEIDPRSRLSRRFKLDTITMATTADDVILDGLKAT